MNEDSLGTLSDIVEHPRFRDRHTSLRVSTYFLSEYLERGKSGSQYDMWCELLWEQQAFLPSDRPTALLTSILCRTPSLRHIEIGQWCEPGCPYDLGWGNNAIESMTECRLDPYYRLNREEGDEDDDQDIFDTPTSYSHNITIIFNSLLTAISAARQPIQSLAATLWTECEGFSDDLRGLEVSMVQPSAHELGTSSDFRSGLEDSFRGMKRLKLALEYGWADNDDHINPHWKQWLVEMVKLAPSLEHLSLYFDNLDLERLGGTFNRLGFLYFARQAHMERLTHLELAHGVVQI